MTKIIRKIVLVLLVFVSLLANINVKANTSLPTTIKMASNFSKFSDNAYGFGQDYFYQKIVSDGTVSYCSGDTHHKAPQGLTMTLVGEVDAGYAYLLANGYPSKSITGDAKKDYFITQQAVWLYNGAISSSKSSKNPEMVEEIYKLYNAAKALKGQKQSNVADAKVTLSANTTLTKSGNYYVSNLITPTVNGSTYTVVATNNAIIKDKSGNIKSTFNKGEGFYIYLANGTTTKVTVTTTTTNIKYYEYKPSSTKYQNVIVSYQYETSTNASASITLTTQDTKLKISKVDATNKTELAGATLVLKNSNGTIVDKWVSTNTPHYIEGLEPGKYTLCETIAPTGYKLQTTCIDFTLEADGKVKSVVMENELKDLTVVKISKQDITNKTELAGATLVVKDSKGNIVDKWVSTNTPHYLSNLTEGTYTLTETIAPDGYVLSNETIEFTVKRDGLVKTVTMYNTKKDLTVVKISKQDITNKTELAGATLVVKDSKGNIVDKWVSTNEPHYLSNLTEGTYTLTETIAPDGYVLSNETIEFTVTNDGKVKTVVMYNTKKDMTVVKISKQDITNGKELEGATLVVKDSNGNIVDKWVSTNEAHYLSNLTEGTYTLTETIAPKGYKLSEETIEFTVTNDGKVKTVIMYNSPVTSVKISKLDATNNKELAGATLVIKDSKGNVIETWVSTNEPHYIEGLEPGIYTLTETIAPEGYELSEETIEFEVKNDGTTTNVVMYNTPYTPVPITGLNSNKLVIILGTILSIFGLGMVFNNVKKREE